jgi:ribosome-binding factor A
MKTRKRLDDHLRALCAQRHDEDGVHPKYDRKQGPRDGDKPNRKDQQLCKQVLRALRGAIGADCNDPILTELDIVGVEPAPDASRLRVVVALPQDTTQERARAVLAHLGRARGHLRAQIAGAISRKRVPELTFQIAPPEPEPKEVTDEA